MEGGPAEAEHAGLEGGPPVGRRVVGWCHDADSGEGGRAADSTVTGAGGRGQPPTGTPDSLRSPGALTAVAAAASRRAGARRATGIKPRATAGSPGTSDRTA